MQKRYLWTTAFVGVTLLLGIGFTVFLLISGQEIAHSKASGAFNEILQPLGFQPVHIESTQLGWGKVHYTKITAIAPTGEKSKPHHLSIEHMVVSLTPWGILTRTLSGIKMDGLRFVLSTEGKSIPWERLSSLMKSERSSIRSATIYNAMIESRLDGQAVKIPFSVDAFFFSPGVQADIRWGTENTPEPNGLIHIQLKPNYAKIELTSHNALVDRNGIKATISALRGKIQYDLSKDISGSFMADIKSLSVNETLTFSQPLLVEGKMEKSAFTATLKAAKEVLLTTTGSISLLPSLVFNMAFDGTIPNIGSIFAIQNRKKPIAGGVRIQGNYPNLTITLSKMTAGLGLLEASEISGTIKIAQLFPFMTSPFQHIRANGIHVGPIDLKDNDLEFSAEPERGLIIHKFKGRALGGTIEAHSFKPTQRGMSFEVDFRSMDLSQLLALANLSTVKAFGDISGSASLLYSQKEGLDLTGAEIKSISDQGRLQIASGSKDNIAFEALEDLHFTLLDVKVRPSTTNIGNLEAIVKILGSNPNVLNGYPFEFNINASGKLKDLVSNTVTSLTKPQDMKEISKKLANIKAGENAQRGLKGK